ncbi:LptF/LptG family permease [Marinicellulosiphila megalodicopiae]|uniref:LptF/LptG family permease n=1 Tax=Marinicellulosiphila megalodicopiae TaxID=2724896 RepID=UPI003BAE3A13
MILARYITKQILLPFALILFVLLLIMISMSLTKLLNNPVIAIAGVEVLFLNVLYKVPGLMYEVMPIAFFLAAFMGIGRMYMDIEMHVLFSCGISKMKLMAYALIPTLIVMGLGAFSENIIRPLASQKYIQLKDDMNDVSLFDFVVAQTFTSIGDTGKVMYVSKVDRDLNQFETVFIAQLGEQIIKAEYGKLEQEIIQTGDQQTSQHFLKLTNGTLYLNLPGQKGYSETQFEQYRLLIEQDNQKPSDSKLRWSTLELMKKPSPYWRGVLVERLFYPLVFLGFLPWALFLAQTPARKSYYWKLLPLIVIYSLHGSGASYVHAQWLSQYLNVWLGRWYWDVILFGLGMLAYGLPQWINKIKAKRL